MSDNKHGYWSDVVKQRMSRRRTLALSAAGLSGAALLAACGSGDSGSSGSSGAQDQSGNYTLKPAGAVKGGRLVQFGPAVPNWNVFSVYNNSVTYAGPNVFDRLMSADLTENRYILEAAESIETPDPLRVILKLKPGMTYQNIAPVNGRAVVADDVTQSQDYVKNLTNAYDRSFQVAFVDKMEAPDDRTVVFRLKKPDGYLYGSQHLGNPSSMSIVPKEMLDKMDTAQWIGSGPFQLQPESTLSQRYLYKRFEKFRDVEHVYMDEREILLIPDIAAQEAALRSDQIHVGPSVFPTGDRILSETGSRFTLSETEGIGLGIIGMNMNPTVSPDMPWKKDLRIRQAMWRFTNRQQMVELAAGGKAATALIGTGTLPAAVKEYHLNPKDTEQFYKFDLKEAKQLMDAAGYDYNQEWELIPFGGVPGSIQEQSAIIWQNQAREAGFKTRINSSLPSSELLSRVFVNSLFQVFFGIAPGGSDPAYPNRLYHSDSLGQFNNFGLHDKAIDALIEKAEETLDFEENKKINTQIQNELLKKYTSPIPIMTPKTRFLYNSKLQNFDTRAVPATKYNYAVWWKP